MSARIRERTERSFEDIEAMPPALRQCVHEYGYAIVQACLQCGVTNPNNIHQLVREIWDGARQPKQRRPRGGSLDWILIQAGAEISAATLVRVLAQNNLHIVPADPTTAMVEASKAEVSDFCERVTKTEKHRRRLRAAIKVGGKHLWPEIAP